MVAVEPSLPRKDSARSTLREKSVFRWKVGCPGVKLCRASVLGCAGAHATGGLCSMLTNLRVLDACARERTLSCYYRGGYFRMPNISFGRSLSVWGPDKGSQGLYYFCRSHILWGWLEGYCNILSGSSAAGGCLLFL